MPHSTTAVTVMSQLPMELLSHIFIQCLPNDPYLESNSVKAPLLLTSVCCEWRELALQMIQLWCSLSTIQEGSLGDGLQLMRLQYMKGYMTWLSRSGNHLLSLAISFDVYAC
ncbi:hypothetical protein HD554DRAFT_2011919 [Boletus coccyginus]|nr:hypothetical protein HD554DRAFT_2011919 [Boletus coccyginus]